MMKRWISVRATLQESQLNLLWKSQKFPSKKAPLPLLKNADISSLERARQQGLFRKSLAESNPQLALEYYNKLKYIKDGFTMLKNDEFVDLLTLISYKDTTRYGTKRSSLDQTVAILNELIAHDRHHTINLLPAFFGRLMNAYARLGNLKRVLDVWRLMPQFNHKVTQSHFEDVLQSFAWNGSLSQVQSLIGEMDSHTDVTLSPRTYASLITAFSKAHRMHKIQKPVQEIVSKNPSSQLIFNALIRGYGREGDVSCMFKMLEQAEQAGIPLTTVTMNNLLSGYAHAGQMKEALAVFDKMLQPPTRLHQQYKCPPDSVTYNILINMYCKAKDPKSALMWLERMIGAGCEPSVHSFTTIMDGFRRVDKLEQVIEMFHRTATQCGGIAHPGPYSVLIAAYMQKGRTKDALTVYEAMIDAHVKPDRYIFEYFIKSFVYRGKMAEALQWYSNMKEEGYALDAKVLYRLLWGFHKHSFGEEQARQLFKEALEARIVTSFESNFMLSICAKNPEADLENLYTEFFDNCSIQPNCKTLEIVKALDQKPGQARVLDSIGNILAKPAH